jgi:DNA-binding transcriptional LysR family regulator
MAIQLQRPTEPDLKVVKLGRLHMMMCASRSYIAAHGHPKRPEDLAGHRFSVLSLGDWYRWEADYQRLLRGVAPTSAVWLRTNSTQAHFWTIAGGAAIGSLPTYLSALGADLIPLDMIEVPPHDIWLVYHPGAKQLTRVRKVLDCVVKAFDPRHAPWFRDEFIHPAKFAALCRGQPIAGKILLPLRDFFQDVPDR